MDKTLKLRAYTGEPNVETAPVNPAQNQNTSVEEEKNKALECLKVVERLRENLKQEQARVLELNKKLAELEVKANEAIALEAKVRQLNDALSKISSIASGRTN